MAQTSWTGEMRKGVMELCVLHLLAQQSGYGYQLAQSLAAYPSLTLKESTLYLMLARLEKDGLLSVTLQASARGPKRRYFTLNTDGRARLAAMSTFWSEFSRDAAQLLGQEPRS